MLIFTRWSGGKYRSAPVDLQRLGYRRPVFWCYEDAKHTAAIDALPAARNIVAAFSGNILSDNTGRSLYGRLTNPEFPCGGAGYLVQLRNASLVEIQRHGVQ